jgi:hypothetical protein
MQRAEVGTPFQYSILPFFLGLMYLNTETLPLRSFA